MMQTRKWAAGPILAAMLVGPGCGGEEAEAPEVLRPVRFEQVFTTGGNRTRTFSGSARAGMESRLSFRVPGTVEEVRVSVGDEVRRGDMIARLDPNDAQLQVQEADAALSRSKANERKAAADYARTRALYESQNASRNSLDAARASDESAKAAVRSAEKTLELAQSQLGYARLTSPADGSIASVEIEPGENVSPGQAAFLLTAGSEIEVEVAVPEVLISRVREGNEVTVSFDAIPGRDFAGSVTEVGVSSTGLATTYPVTVLLGDASDEIRSGMAAEVAFRFASADNRERIFVPSMAVGEDRTGRYVFVVATSGEDEGTVARRAVTIGDLTEDGIEVFDGLEDGDYLVTAGLTKLSDGERVRFQAPTEEAR